MEELIETPSNYIEHDRNYKRKILKVELEKDWFHLMTSEVH